MNQFIAKKWGNETPNEMSSSVDAIDKFADIVNLSIGDPDFPTDTCVIEGAFSDAKKGHTHYTNPMGDPQLKEEIIKYYKEDFSFSLDPNEIMVTTSANHGMWLVMQTVLNPQDEVIIPEPFFSPYAEQVKMAGGVPVFLPTYEEEGFQIDFEELKKAITNKTKAILINTPNNPTGACMTKENLTLLGEIATQYNLLIIADDIYTTYSFQHPFVSILTISGLRERVISLRSFSKDYNMTGWRIGYVIAPKEIALTMKEINESCVFSAPSVSQRAAIYALQNRREIQPKYVKTVKERADFCYSEIKKIPYLSVLPPKGSLYLFVNIKKSGLTSSAFCKKLLEKCHVLAIPGTAFGTSGEGYIRLALTVSIEKLKEAFERMKKWDPQT